MDRLRDVRKQRGLSQVRLAEMVGCSQQAIADYERGKSVPAGDTLVRIARILGVSSAYLLGHADTPERDDRLPDDWVAVVEEAMAGGYSPEQIRRVIRGLRVMLGQEQSPPDPET